MREVGLNKALFWGRGNEAGIHMYPWGSHYLCFIFVTLTSRLQP